MTKNNDDDQNEGNELIELIDKEQLNLAVQRLTNNEYSEYKDMSEEKKAECCFKVIEEHKENYWDLWNTCALEV